MLSARKKKINKFLNQNKNLLTGLIVDLGGSSKFKDKNNHLFVNANKYFSVNKDENIKCDLNCIFPDIKLPDSFADNVMCLETIEYVSDPAKFLLNIHKLLKNNGHLILSSPFMFPIHHDSASDFYRLTLSFYKYHLKNLFKFKKVITIGGPFEILFDSIRTKFSYKINFISKILLLIWSIFRPLFTLLDFLIFRKNNYANSGYFLVLQKI